MRLSSAILSSSLVLAGEKKVPPRHPRNRLRTLTRFSKEWLDVNLRNFDTEDKKLRRRGGAYADRFSERFSTWSARLLRIVDQPDRDCFFFDPQAPHGGKQKREAGDEPSENAENSENNSDIEYDYSDEADDLLRYDKNNPQRGLRQITTGFRKWAQRYFSDCKNEQESQRHSKRANKWYTKILGKYKDLVDKQDADRR